MTAMYIDVYCSVCQLRNALFEYNQAIEFSLEVKETDSPALRRWRQEWQKAFADEESQHMACPECLQGRGGAVYLSLGKIRDRATVLLHLVDVTIRYNSALVGGKSVSVSVYALNSRLLKVVVTLRPLVKTGTERLGIGNADTPSSLIESSGVTILDIAT